MANPREEIRDCATVFAVFALVILLLASWNIKKLDEWRVWHSTEMGAPK